VQFRWTGPVLAGFDRVHDEGKVTNLQRVRARRYDRCRKSGPPGEQFPSGQRKVRDDGGVEPRDPTGFDGNPDLMTSLDSDQISLQPRSE